MKAVGERSPGPLARNATETHPLPPPLVIIRITMTSSLLLILLSLYHYYYYPARALRALGLLLADGTPTVGGGKTFWAVIQFLFTKTAVSRERKVEKSIPRWEMNGLSEGYKRAVDQNWGRMAKIGFLDPKPKFWAQKKRPTFGE